MNKISVVAGTAVNSRLEARNFPTGTVAIAEGDVVHKYWMVTGAGHDEKPGLNRWTSLHTGYREVRTDERDNTSYINGRILPSGAKIQIEIA